MVHGTLGLSGLALAWLLLSGTTAVVGWNIALSVTAQVDGAVGGEPFATQPTVIVTDKSRGPQPSFVGRMTARTLALPDCDHDEPLCQEGADADAAVAQDVAGGRVDFAGLGIDAAGEGYRLKFVLYDEHGLIMGEAAGDAFAVAVGERFRLAVTRLPTTQMVKAG